MLEKPSVNAVSCICLLEKLGVNEAIIILHIVKI